MNSAVYSHIALLSCLFLGAVFGAVQLLRKKRGKYYLNIFLGYVGFFLGEVFTALYPFMGGNIFNFCIGDLGTLSGYAFIICANKSLLPKLSETDAKLSAGKRLLCFTVPALELLSIVSVFLIKYPDSTAWLISDILSVLAPIPCAYYTMKALLTPHTKGDFSDCMKGSNLLLCGE